MYKTIIWATDGSDGADAALKAAQGLAEWSGGHIVAVHCDQRLTGRGGGWPALADEDDLRIKIRRQIGDLESEGVDIDLVVRRSHDQPADVIAAVAAELDADVIVCGTRGHGAVSGALLGSFTHRLLHAARCPVLAIPELGEQVHVEQEQEAEVHA